MINHEGAAKLSKQIIKYAIKTEQSHVQFQFPIPNSSFGYLILVITSRHPSDVFYWAGERSIPCLANHEEEAEPSSISTTPQRNNSTHNKSVWKTASTPDTGRDRFQTGFKERGQQVHLTYIISCFSKSKFWLIGCFWLFLMIFDGLQNGESCGGKVEEIASTINEQRASVISMIAFGFLICLDFKLINWKWWVLKEAVLF